MRDYVLRIGRALTDKQNGEWGQAWVRQLAEGNEWTKRDQYGWATVRDCSILLEQVLEGLDDK